MRVLIFDHNTDICRSLETALKESGYFVISACSSAEAIDALRRETIDIILETVPVPGIDGFSHIPDWKSSLDPGSIPFSILIPSPAPHGPGCGPDPGMQNIKPALPDEFLHILKSLKRKTCAGAAEVAHQPDEGEKECIAADSTIPAGMPDNGAGERQTLYHNLCFLFDTMTDGVIFFDRYGCIIHANPSAERILGLSLDRMKGRTSIHSDGYYIHEDGSPYPGDTHPAVVALHTGKVTRDVMGIYTPSEGIYRWIQVTAVPQLHPSEKVPYQVYSLFVDITEQKVSSKRIAHLNKVLLAISGVNRLITGERDPGALARNVCRLLVKERDYTLTWLILIDGSGNILDVVQEESGGIRSAFVDHVLRGSLPECTRKISSAGGIVSIQNPQSSCDSCPNAPHIRQGGSLISRLEVDGNTYGFIGVAISGERVPDHQEQELFKEIANGVAFALHHIAIERIEREAISALKESEEKFRLFAENIDDVFWMSRPGLSRMIYVSPAFKTIWGMTLENLDALPACLIDSVHPDDKESLLTGLHLHAQGKHFCVTYRIIRPDGSIRWICDRGFPVFDSSGACRFMLGLASDITEVKTAELALKEELERRMDFISIASHELRTPLQPIVGYLHLILDNPGMYGLNDEGTNLLREMQQSVTHEVEIVNRMLEVSLLDVEHDVIKPEITNVYLRDCIERIIRGGSHQDQAEFNIQVAPELSIKSDVNYLYEVLNEVISNAIRYSRPPRLVSIAYFGDPLFHVLSVTDNGVGMSAKTLGNLFRPFYTPDNAKLSRTFGRLGLGLTIAKKRIEMLGGDITIRSAPGQGTMVTILLPKREGEQ